MFNFLIYLSAYPLIVLAELERPLTKTVLESYYIFNISIVPAAMTGRQFRLNTSPK